MKKVEFENDKLSQLGQYLQFYHIPKPMMGKPMC